MQTLSHIFSYVTSCFMTIYCKILIISPEISSKGCFAGLIFGEAYFQRGLLLEEILCFKMV